MKSLLTGILLLGFITSANAIFYDRDTFLTDTNSNLDWLDLTASINRSYNDVSTQFGIGGDFEGWRYASADELDIFFSNWFGISGRGCQNCDEDLTFLLLATIGVTGWSCSNQYCADTVGIIGTTWGTYEGNPTPEHYWANITCNKFGSGPCFANSLWANGPDSYTLDNMRVGSFLVRTSVPEATSLYLLSLGLLVLLVATRRKI